MSRASVVYLVMIVFLVGGLWAVLAIGGMLSAPEDLAGKWELQPVTGSSATTATVEQSGKFFQVAIDRGPLLDLKLTEQTSSGMLLVHKPWQLKVSGKTGSDDKSFLLTGPQPGQWTAHRIVRTFPPDLPAKEGH